ncbi:MAG: SDR family NAD(P)-dependent oxidoreductase [Polyangiaceae bacterium]|nr:SDR family NAD(P)-dependent oxidoreductase [Polyangiaceae bacterium]
MVFVEKLRSRYDGAFVATVGGIVDRFKARNASIEIQDSDRLDGRVGLVTGANRGLGLAIAKALAARGADLRLACRSGIAAACEEVGRAVTRDGNARGEQLDLGRLDSVESFVEDLANEGVRFDLVVLNAGIVPREARRTADGLDESFQVNFLSNVLLVRRMLERDLFARGDGPMPRIVVVSSESHRSSPPIDWENFGSYRKWGMREAVEQYGYGKLLLQTFTEELMRRTEGRISVHSLCPGAVRTDIGREAPTWAKPLLSVSMRLFFAEPEVAALPVTYLSASSAIEGKTGIYLHGKQRKDVRDDARDPALGRRIWEASERKLEELGHKVGGTREGA